MFHKIIIGYDGSPGAADALAVAERLGDRGRTQLVLAGAYPPDVLARRADFGNYERVLRKLARDALEEGLGKVDTGWEKTSVLIRAEPAARGLTDVAEDLTADLVVVGSHRLGRIGRIVLGSTGERLLKGAPCAVAVAPRGGLAHDAVGCIGVAYHGSPEATAALDTAYALAAEWDADVVVFTVASVQTFPAQVAASTHGLPPEEVAHEQAEALARAAVDRAPAGTTVRTEVLSGPPAKAIAHRAAGSVDLLVAGSRGHGPVRKVLLGSVSAALLREASFPMLIVPRTAVTERNRPSSATSGARG